MLIKCTGKALAPGRVTCRGPLFLKWQSSSQVITVHIKKKNKKKLKGLECQSPLRCTGQNRKTQAGRLNEPLLAQGQWDRWPWGVHMGRSVRPKRIPGICVFTRRRVFPACASVNLHNLSGRSRKPRTARVTRVCRWVDEIKVAAGRLRGPRRHRRRRGLSDGGWPGPRNR